MKPFLRFWRAKYSLDKLTVKLDKSNLDGNLLFEVADNSFMEKISGDSEKNEVPYWQINLMLCKPSTREGEDSDFTGQRRYPLRRCSSREEVGRILEEYQKAIESGNYRINLSVDPGSGKVEGLEFEVL